MLGPMGDDVTDAELEALALRVREIQRKNQLARIAGGGIGVVALLAGGAVLHLTSVRLFAAIVGGGLMLLAGYVWRSLESKVHVDDL